LVAWRTLRPSKHPAMNRGAEEIYMGASKKSLKAHARNYHGRRWPVEIAGKVKGRGKEKNKQGRREREKERRKKEKERKR